MPAFAWKALRADGKQTKGLLEADSDRHARRLLREQGLTPLSVAASADRSEGGKAESKLRLKPVTVVLFTRLLGALLESGLPLDDALTAIARQSSDANLRLVALEIRAAVLEGLSLGEAVGRFPRSFPEVYVATVGAGEQTRLLPLVLQRVADYLERRQAVLQKIRLALIYPAVLTVVAIAVVGGLLAFVVPQIVTVFEHSDRPLPGITRALLALSGFVAGQWPFLLAGVGVAAAGLRFALRRPGVRYSLQQLALGVPALSGFIKANEAARFARTLGILLNSGLGMLEALSIAAQSVGNQPIRRELSDAAARVREGTALGVSLAQCPSLPPLLAHLATSGESAGELPKMLETAALAAERDVELKLAVGLNLLEPALILTMGLVVLSIVLAILLPIFEMNRLV